MTRELAQAGNTAGRTELHLQWWDDSPVRLAVTSVADKQRDSSLLFFASMALAWRNDGMAGTFEITMFVAPIGCEPLSTIPSRPFGYDQV